MPMDYDDRRFMAEQHKLWLEAASKRQTRLMEFIHIEANRILSGVYLAASIMAFLMTIVMIAIMLAIGG